MNERNNTINLEELETIQDTINKGKTVLGRAEGKLSNLTAQENQKLKAIQDLGLNPENLEEDINKMIQEEIRLKEEALPLIPTELIEKLFNSQQ